MTPASTTYQQRGRNTDNESIASATATFCSAKSRWQPGSDHPAGDNRFPSGSSPPNTWSQCPSTRSSSAFTAGQAVELKFAVNNIGQFSGRDTEDVNTHVSRFRDETETLTDDTSVRAFRLTLTGNAKQWFDRARKQTKDRFRTSADCLQWLIEKYDTEPHDRMKAEQSYVQQEDEDAADYVLRKLKLIEDAYPTLNNESKVYHLADGVHGKYRGMIDARKIASMSNGDPFESFELYLRHAMDRCVKDLKQEPVFATTVVTTQPPTPAVRPPDANTQDLLRENEELKAANASLEAFLREKKSGPYDADWSGWSRIRQEIEESTVARLSGKQAPKKKNHRLLDPNSVYYHPDAGRMVDDDECLNCLSKLHALRQCQLPKRHGLDERRCDPKFKIGTDSKVTEANIGKMENEVIHLQGILKQKKEALRKAKNRRRYQPSVV